MKKRWALYLAPILLLAGAEAWAQGVLDEGDVPTGVDVDFQSSVTTIRASWAVGTGPYTWAIGTTPGGEEIQILTAAGITGQTAERLDLSLVPGAIYYVSVYDTSKLVLFVSDGITVGVGLPVASPASGTAPLLVSFCQQLAGVLFYEWNFDAPTAWNPNLPADVDLRGPVSGDASFVYTVPGAREAELRIHHAGGEILTQRVPVQVDPSPGAPSVALATVPSSPTGTVPLAVTFTASAQTSDGTVLVYLWDFDGDGIPDASGESPTIAHTFRATGTFQAGVTVVDAAGRTASQAVAVTGTGVQAGLSLPTVSWTGIAPSPAPVGTLVTFTAQGTSGGTDQLQAFHWDFDGNGVTDRVTTVSGTSASVAETWQFEGPGTYAPRVTVVDVDGLSVTASSLAEASLDPAAKRCWILQPFPGTALFGDHVSLLAAAVPPDSVTGIEFKYRPADPSPFPPPTNNAWISIGTLALGSDLVPGLHWDLSALPVGPYDLIAVATFADGTTDVSSADVQEITVTISADEASADVAEYSGSPVTSLLLSRISPVATSFAAIQRDTLVRVPPGSVPSYAQMRLERRGDNPYPVEARLQGLRFLPNHFRRVGLVGASGLGKPSRVALYLGQTTGTRLPDGTDLTRASFKIYRFDTGRTRWEPLPDSVSSPRQGLAQASLAVPGDLGVAVFLDRDEPGSSSGCGGLGVEAALLLWALLRWRRR
jgi:hypothetical protein